jgi:type I restriction enzyme M protein
MWNQPFSPDIFEDDPFDRFTKSGGVTSGKGDWAWLQHTLNCMSTGGRAAVVLDTGSVARGSGSRNDDKERNIRRWFVDRDLIDGVILLPENLFYNTNAAGVIVVLNRNKTPARQRKIVLLNASRRFRKGRPKNYLPDEDVRELASLYIAGGPVAGELTVISTTEAADADYNLSPGRWVTGAPADDTPGLKSLLAEFTQLQQEERAIADELGAALVSLGELV